MSMQASESRYLLQTFNHSHQESNGDDVYVGKDDTRYLELLPSGLLATTLWSQAGPVHIQIRHTDDPSTGVLIQLQGRQCEILIQKSHTPIWMTVFNFLSGPVILVPTRKELTPLRNVQRISAKNTTDEEEQRLKKERVIRKHHLIVPTKPGRSPSPHPQATFDYLQRLAA